jgi:DNA-binding HxlR family transcriptional regulator
MLLRRTYDNQNCSAARALEVVGERWSLLIIRDALFRGSTRFSEFQQSLRIAPTVLARRLESFVDADLMEIRRVHDPHSHHRYILTQKGRDLAPVLIALMVWGDRWVAAANPVHCRRVRQLPTVGSGATPPRARVAGPRPPAPWYVPEPEPEPGP